MKTTLGRALREVSKLIDRSEKNILYVDGDKELYIQIRRNSHPDVAGYRGLNPDIAKLQNLYKKRTYTKKEFDGGRRLTNKDVKVGERYIYVDGNGIGCTIYVTKHDGKLCFTDSNRSDFTEIKHYGINNIRKSRFF